jgi:hypothetical protein
MLLTRATASRRLIEAAHRMYADQVDDVAVLTVVGAVMTGALEEIEPDVLKGKSDHPIAEFFDGAKEQFSHWFNFLKHGSRGPRSPGDELDFSFLGEGVYRDEVLFGYLWQSALYHVAAYEESTELIDSIILRGYALFAFGEDETDEEEASQLRRLLRQLALTWYSREERATANGIDREDSRRQVLEIVGPIAKLLMVSPKRPVRNKKS